MADELHTLIVGRDAMACRFEVALNAGEYPSDTEIAIEALDIVDDVEARISVYRPTSELSHINTRAAEGWVDVSPDVWPLLLRADELGRQTEGGFDIAAGALVRAWGFLHRQGRTPAVEELAAAVAATGMRHVELDHAGRRVRFLRPGIEINPGAIGKGWALDRAAAHLAARGVNSVLVHGGQSSVIARGTQGPAGGDRHGWRVGLRHPLRPGRRLATITLDDQALGTSGSGTQFFIDRGRRLGHILDPRSGRPAEGVISATVITDSAADADALATALYVLGPSGLPTIAPPRTATAAVLVVPAPDGGTRLLVANLDDRQIDIETEPGLTVERVCASTPLPDPP